MKKNDKATVNHFPLSPTWMLIIGVVFLILAVVFLMALVLMTTFKGVEVPQSSNFLIVSILALTVSTGSGFLGGYATANGNLKVPYLDTPIKLAIGGGTAVFIIVLMIGNFLFPSKLESESFDNRNNQLSENDNQVSELRKQVLILRGKWETLDESPTDTHHSVFKSANTLVRSLIQIKSNLNDGHIIDRDQYAAYACLMAADAADRVDKVLERDKFIDQGLDLANKAETNIKAALKLADQSPNDYRIKLKNDIIKYHDLERVHLLQAMFMALDSLRRGKFSREQALTKFQSIPKNSLTSLDLREDSIFWIKEINQSKL